jgi:hypothetical protein
MNHDEWFYLAALTHWHEHAIMFPKSIKLHFITKRLMTTKSSTVSDPKNIQKNIVMKCSGVLSTIHTYNVISEMLGSINSKAKEASQGNI